MGINFYPTIIIMLSKIQNLSLKGCGKWDKSNLGVLGREFPERSSSLSKPTLYKYIEAAKGK